MNGFSHQTLNHFVNMQHSVLKCAALRQPSEDFQQHVRECEQAQFELMQKWVRRYQDAKETSIKR
uniref:Uncharacterized protein n=1 Tax=viral metagenome TaxID=1070528 RepID=A0A6C0BP13_9ZZZZ